MTQLTRRHLLAGAATATAATALAPVGGTGIASAAAPAVGKQAAGFYRYKVGDFEITLVTDGARSFPLPDTLVKNAKKDEVNAALQSAHMPKDQMTIPFTATVVNTGSKLVAIDTGNGLAAFDQSKGAVGQYQSNLAAAGIDAKSVDVVVISHFHGDHINGLLGADGKPVFANAEIMVPAPEWAYWTDEGNASRAAEGLKGNFANVKRVFDALGRKVTQYEGGKEIAPGITSMATPGHTPGHMSYTVASGSGRLFVQSDVSNHPALFVRNPGWHAAFDMDGAMAEATRRKVYDMASADRMLVQGYHTPFPSAGYVEKDGNGYRLVPMAWNPSI
jgi:glyoxylase-like metal-dependent hydrolase (beta-lactamase superfamily II)